jgi:hypothetical protein
MARMTRVEDEHTLEPTIRAEGLTLHGLRSLWNPPSVKTKRARHVMPRPLREDADDQDSAATTAAEQEKACETGEGGR